MKKCVDVGELVYLDNSLYELGEAYDGEKFMEYIYKLKPTYCVVPDCYGDCQKNNEMLMDWLSKYGKECEKLNVKTIGVIHGSNYDELINSYKFVSLYVDMVAFSFKSAAYINDVSLNKYTEPYKLMYGRIKALNYLNNIIHRSKKHHLMGIALPQEMVYYRNSKFNYIYSVDTSNPILHAMVGIVYHHYGLDDKSSIKMENMFDELIHLNPILYYNINKFKEFTNG